MSYRELFDQAIGAAPPTTVDHDHVIRRERRAAVLRPVLATAAAVMVVTVGVVTTVGLSGDDQAIPPVDETIEGFPEYYQGHRVVAATSAPFTDGAVSLAFTFRGSDVLILSRCERGDLAPDAASCGCSATGRRWCTAPGGTTRGVDRGST